MSNLININEGKVADKKTLVFLSARAAKKCADTSLDIFEKQAKSRGYGFYCLNPEFTTIDDCRDNEYVFTLADTSNNTEVVCDIRNTIIIPRRSAITTRTSCDLLKLLKFHGFFLVNTLDVFLACEDKFETYRVLSNAGIPTPDTILCPKKNVQKALDKASVWGYPIVGKLPSGTQGIGVFIMDSPNSALSVLQAMTSTTDGVILQRFINSRCDYRVHVLNNSYSSLEPKYEVIGMMRRSHTKEDFRSNYHLGASVEIVNVENTDAEVIKHIEDIAIAAAKAVGAVWCGVDVIVSEETFLASEMIIGDVFAFPLLSPNVKDPIRLRVVGVFDVSDPSDSYWQKDTRMFTNTIFVRSDQFLDYFVNNPDRPKFSINCNIYDQFDYMSVDASEAADISAATDRYLNGQYGPLTSRPGFMDVLDKHESSRRRISVSLLLLEIPLLLLLAAFILMISGQLYSMEENEISMYKSRGASSGQIFILYLLQSVIIAVIASCIGVPIGMFVCRGLGSASSFLEFGITFTKRRVRLHIACCTKIAYGGHLAFAYTRTHVIHQSRIGACGSRFKGAAADLHILADRLIIDRIVSVEMPVCHSGQNLELYRLRIVIAAKISMITREPAFSDPYLAAGSEFQVMAIPDIFEGHFVKGQIRRMSDLHDAAPIPAPVPGSSDKMNP